MAKPIFKWAPAVGAVVVVAAAAITIPMTANASATLPEKSATQVLEMVARSHVSAFSGTIQQTSNLGLPSLPSTGPGSDSSVASTLDLLTGTHTVRVYADGAKNQRLQVLDQEAERDVIRHGKDLWVWDSKANTAVHATVAPHKRASRDGRTGGRKAHLGAMKQGQLPGTMSSGSVQAAPWSLAQKTPAQVASSLIKTLSPSSHLSVPVTAPDVAGRSVYDLVLTPKATGTLLGSVTIAVDSATGLPLGVDVAARGQATPAFSIHFSQLTIAKPAASLFTFTPPANAKVTQEKPHRAAKPGARLAKPGTKGTAATKPTVTGTGWDAVITIPKQAALTKLEASREFGLLTSPVAGGTLFSTSLVNILFESDGRVLVGSVSAARLEAVAAQS